MNIGVLALTTEPARSQAVLDACIGGALPGRVGVVISNNSRFGALVRAQDAGVLA